MEDYLNYMNSVSESESVLNQVNAIKENVINQADIKSEEKDQLKEQITGIPSELLISSAGAYLGKKAISYVASKIGVSEDTVSKFVSGDIEGGLKQGLGEVARDNMPSYSQEQTEQELPEPEMGPEQEGDIELEDLTPPSQDEALNMLAGEERTTITSEDLPEGAGSIMDAETPIMDVGEAVESIGSSVAETAGSIASSVADTVGGIASSVASTAGSIAGTAGDIVSSVAETAGAEAVGAGLDATGVLAPLGALVGLIGGFVGLFEGMHHDAPKIVQPFEPMLNPSSQIL